MTPFYQDSTCTIYHGNCLEIMDIIIDGSIDAIITDPPYGITACKWDTTIPLDPMWTQLKRVIKPRGAVILFGSELFSSYLRLSNTEMYKHDWVWYKSNPTGFLNAKKYPLKCYELIHIFCKKMPVYNPQFLESTPMRTAYTSGGGSDVYSDAGLKAIKTKKENINKTWRYPQNLIKINSVNNFSKEKVAHPTQKPVALMEYLIKTYTNEGDMILDFAAGSGSTLVAAKSLGRKIIGIEIEEKYCDIAVRRIEPVFDETTMEW